MTPDPRIASLDSLWIADDSFHPADFPSAIHRQPASIREFRTTFPYFTGKRDDHRGRVPAAGSQLVYSGILIALGLSEPSGDETPDDGRNRLRSSPVPRRRAQPLLPGFQDWRSPSSAKRRMSRSSVLPD